MVDVKKFSEIDLYGLLGIEIGATEAEVRPLLVELSEQNLLTMVRFRFAKHIARKPSNAIRIRIPTTRRRRNCSRSCPRH